MCGVSFGSNYRFGIGSKYPDEVMHNLGNYEIKGAEIYQEYTSMDEAAKTGIFSKVTVSTPDRYDGEIETLLLSHGIDFHKQTFAEALKPENIKSRIKLSETDKLRNYNLVEIDTKKLDELLKNSNLDTYVGVNGKNGIGSRYQQVGEFLKTGRDINPTIVYLTENGNNLTASIVDGRHRFAYLRDMGMKRIPVSLDSSSFRLAKKYGLTLEHYINVKKY